MRSHWRRSGGRWGTNGGEGLSPPHARMHVLIIMCSFDDHHFVSRWSSYDHAREVSVRALFGEIFEPKIADHILSTRVEKKMKREALKMDQHR